MPKSFNQKLKILYLMDVLLERTDEEHPITAKDMAQYLRGYGISVERKTIYDDIEALRIYGLDIRNRRGKVGGFYIANRKFQLPEVKFLMDAVQSSRFVTQKKSRELLRKLESLVVPEAAKKLREQLFIEPGNKTVNEEIYSNIQTIYEGISNNRQIRFHYYEWTLSRELKPRKNGEWYQVSPWKMIWKNENYYLLCLDENSGVLKHYRVDKMLHIRMSDESREGKEHFKKLDMADYAKKSFGMFRGKETSVKMLVNNSLAGVIIDRFGKDVMMIPTDEEHFTVKVDVHVSRQFLGWIFSLGEGIKIVGPEEVVNQMKAECERLMGQYQLPQ